MIAVDSDSSKLLCGVQLMLLAVRVCRRLSLEKKRFHSSSSQEEKEMKKRMAAGREKRHALVLARNSHEKSNSK